MATVRQCDICEGMTQNGFRHEECEAELHLKLLRRVARHLKKKPREPISRSLKQKILEEFNLD